MATKSLQPLTPIAAPLVSVKAELTLKIGGAQYLLIDRVGDSQEIVSIVIANWPILYQAANSSLKLDSVHENPAPFVVFPVGDGDKITDSYLKAFRSRHLDADDIFQPIFLKNVIFYVSEETNVSLEPSAVSLLATWNTTKWHSVKSADEKNEIAPGPYISHQGRIWEPWRIYNDDTLSMVSFKPASKDRSRSYV